MRKFSFSVGQFLFSLLLSLKQETFGRCININSHASYVQLQWGLFYSVQDIILRLLTYTTKSYFEVWFNSPT